MVEERQPTTKTPSQRIMSAAAEMAILTGEAWLRHIGGNEEAIYYYSIGKSSSGTISMRVMT